MTPRPLPKLSTWAEQYVEDDPEDERPEPKYVGGTKPRASRPAGLGESLLERVEAMHADERAKGALAWRKAWRTLLPGFGCVLLYWVPGLGVFLWLAGVVLMARAFFYWRDAMGHRLGARMMPDPNDFTL